VAPLHLADAAPAGDDDRPEEAPAVFIGRRRLRTGTWRERPRLNSNDARGQGRL